MIRLLHTREALGSTALAPIHFSLLPEGRYWINAAGTQGGEQSRETCGQREGHSRGDQRDKVVWIKAEDLGTYELIEEQHQYDSCGNTYPDHQ